MIIAILRPWYREHPPVVRALSSTTIKDGLEEAKDKFIKQIRPFNEKELLDVISTENVLCTSEEDGELILKDSVSEKYWKMYRV